MPTWLYHARSAMFRAVTVAADAEETISDYTSTWVAVVSPNVAAKPSEFKKNKGERTYEETLDAWRTPARGCQFGKTQMIGGSLRQLPIMGRCVVRVTQNGRSLLVERRSVQPASSTYPLQVRRQKQPRVSETRQSSQICYPEHPI